MARTTADNAGTTPCAGARSAAAGSRSARRSTARSRGHEPGDRHRPDAVTVYPSAIATWYGPRGARAEQTACGVRLTKATARSGPPHPALRHAGRAVLPGRTITVPVIDRGPYAKQRVLGPHDRDIRRAQLHRRRGRPHRRPGRARPAEPAELAEGPGAGAHAALRRAVGLGAAFDWRSRRAGGVHALLGLPRQRHGLTTVVRVDSDADRDGQRGAVQGRRGLDRVGDPQGQRVAPLRPVSPAITQTRPSSSWATTSARRTCSRTARPMRANASAASSAPASRRPLGRVQIHEQQREAAARARAVGELALERLDP